MMVGHGEMKLEGLGSTSECSSSAGLGFGGIKGGGRRWAVVAAEVR
jgi:hypothetical protein